MAELKNLIVNGAARINGDIYGNLKGNADTATNADTLDGKHASEFSLSGHTHSQYSQTGHTHDDRYFTETEVTNKLAGKSDTGHTHSQYSQTGHTHDDRYFTETEVTNKLAGKSNTGHTHTKSEITNFPTLATVATSGSYNDLSNKPTIPSAVTESTVSGWGFTKNTGTYSKPSSGIPKSDLASAVQTSLGKADSALQTHQSIKTINNQSIIGTGNITISSGVEEAPNDGQSYIRKNKGWTSLSVAMSETVNVALTCEDPSKIIGARVTVEIDGAPSTYTWSGSTITFFVPEGISYTISYSQITDYETPASETHTAIALFTRNITVEYVEYSGLDLSMIDIISGSARSSRETANCYVIKEIGTYKFPLVYGCAISGGTVNTASYTRVSANTGNTQPFFNYKGVQIASPYIETDTGFNAASGSVVYSDSSGIGIDIDNIVIKSGKVGSDNCRYLQFEVTSVPALGGNTIIGIKDGSGTIMWSWHLWFYPDTLSTIDSKNSNNVTYSLLNVNLGYVKPSSGDFGRCPYYQWGRKDPMLRDGGANTGEKPFTTGSTATSLATTIQNPNVFNTKDARNNWWNNNGTVVNFYNYWDANQTGTGNTDNTIVKTVYDPCPSGFGIPCGNTFLGMDSGSSWGNSGRTWNYRFFPASGYRSNSSGGIYNVGSSGYYWLSSSNSENFAFRLYFYSSGVGPQYYDHRAGGFAVCPVLLRT